MEKRLFIAIGLSMMIVWLWSATAPKPISSPKTSKRPIISESKSIAPEPIISNNPSSSVQRAASPVLEDSIDEQLETIESPKLKAIFSNIGASLRKVIIKEYEATPMITKITDFVGYEHVPFTLDIISDNEIVFNHETNDLKITKLYKISPNEYTIETSVKVYNKLAVNKNIVIETDGYSLEMSSLDNKDKGAQTIERDKSLFEYVVSTETDIHRKGGAFKFSKKELREEFGKVMWSGFRDRYFCALIKPLYETSGYKILPVDEHTMRLSVKSKEVAIAPRTEVQFDSLIYIGPERIDILKNYKYGFEKIRRYYRFGLFDGVAKLIASLMRLIYKFVPNWGATIVLISILIYFSMYPLTMKGMLSMKKMQTIQPLILQLKEKHKDNPQKINKEMMELYKEHKVNPLGGCLPMLLQMPVFIGLYQVLWRSVSFKGAGFLWIKDLSEPDRLFQLPFTIPFLGNDFNLLPLIMIVVMFVQQKITTKNMVITDPAQAAQQKMMTTIMPFFLGVIFYKFASGLTLYFTMFYLFSTFTQWKMSKQTRGVLSGR